MRLELAFLVDEMGVFRAWGGIMDERVGGEMCECTDFGDFCFCCLERALGFRGLDEVEGRRKGRDGRTEEGEGSERHRGLECRWELG